MTTKSSTAGARARNLLGAVLEGPKLALYGAMVAAALAIVLSVIWVTDEVIE